MSYFTLQDEHRIHSDYSSSVTVNKSNRNDVTLTTFTGLDTVCGYWIITDYGQLRHLQGLPNAYSTQLSKDGIRLRMYKPKWSLARQAAFLYATFEMWKVRRAMHSLPVASAMHLRLALRRVEEFARDTYGLPLRSADLRLRRVHVATDVMLSDQSLKIKPRNFDSMPKHGNYDSTFFPERDGKPETVHIRLRTGVYATNGSKRKGGKDRKTMMSVYERSDPHRLRFEARYECRGTLRKWFNDRDLFVPRLLHEFPTLLEHHAKFIQRFGLSEVVQFCSMDRCKEILDGSTLGKVRRKSLERKLTACLDSNAPVCSPDRRELIGLGIWPVWMDGVTEIQGLPEAIAGILNGRQQC